jgi:sugar lactone lactonase YvrE
MPQSVSAVTHAHPGSAIEGGRVTLEGSGFRIDHAPLPAVLIGAARARVSYAAPDRLVVIVPSDVDGGEQPITVDGVRAAASLQVGGVCATGLHQVDNPVFDRDGNLYVTYSGTRGQQVPVSIFRVRPNGTRETFSSGIVNPTSMAIDPDGQLYVSSRFEGIVYRVQPDGSVEPFATDLGVACGLAFAPDGTLFVGDRSGTIFAVDREGRARTMATLTPSVAAFHLAYGPAGAPDAALYVTGPTLAPYDSLYRIEADGTISTRYSAFGRPQGLAFDRHGVLHVVEALAGISGVYRLRGAGDPELVVAGPGLVGVAFDRRGAMVVASNETAYRFVRPASD